MNPAEVEAFIQAQVQAQVQAALAVAMAQVPAPAPAPTAAPAPTRIKPAKPEAFLGKANENVRQWIFSVELWFSAGGVLTDHERIVLAVGLLRDSALVWWRSVHDLPDVPTTWEEFKAATIHAFEPINPAESARDRLATLRQTSSVRTYASIFRFLAMSIPGITDDEKKDRFIRGLKLKTMSEVKLRAPETFEEAVRMAVRFDSLLFVRNFNPSVKTGNSHPRPEPMELGAIRTNSIPTGNPPRAIRSVNAITRPSYRDVTAGRPYSNPQRAKLTPEERTKLSREGRCFKCREKGHLARDCPERTNRPN